MKKLFYILCCLLAVLFTACEGEEPKSPEDSTKPGNNPTYDGTFVAKPFSVSATKTVTFSPGNLQIMSGVLLQTKLII